MNNKYQDIIVEIIKNNPRFQGHEDSLDSIYEDVVERLGNVLDTIEDEIVVRNYIEKIAHCQVLRDILGISQ